VAEFDPKFKIPTSDDKTLVDEDGLIADVEKRIKGQETILRELQRQWFTNIAMRRGLQNIQSDRSGIRPPAELDEGRVRIIINKMLGIHQTRVAKLVTDISRGRQGSRAQGNQTTLMGLD
jgi:hypothetical protein